MRQSFQDGRRGRRAGFALLVSALLGVSSASAAGFATQVFPVPVSVEKERVRSSMRLQLDVQRYGVPFDAFAAQHLDPAESAFRDFMTALRAGDVAKVATLRRGDTPETVKKLVDGFHPGFAREQVPRVVARIAVGADQLFVWQWETPRGPMRRGFTVVEAVPGAARVEVVTSARPLETLVVDVMQQELVQPEQYAPGGAGTAAGRHRYTFPLRGTGRPGAHPVVLFFDGQAVDVEVMGKDRVLPAALGAGLSAAAGVFQSAYHALSDRDLEGYFGAYTETSRDKLRAWAEALTPAELNSFLAATVKPRRVRFLLDADPVGIVFYTVENEPRLRYEYVLRTAGGYKLTNAYFEGFLDDVLRDNALFPADLESFRKNVLAANPK